MPRRRSASVFISVALCGVVLTAGCYTKTTARRGTGKPGYVVDRRSPSTLSDAKVDPMVLTPPATNRMPW